MATKSTIPAHRIGDLRARVAELNKRAGKLGMQPVILHEGAPRWEDFSETVEGGVTRRGKRHVVEVELVGQAPVIGGSVFVAKLEHTAAGNLISKGFGQDERDLTAWRQASSRCQHCGLDRRRSCTYLVETQGALVQVGSDCLDDYTRSANAEAAVHLMNLWAELGNDIGDEDGEYWGGWYPDPTPLEYLAAAVRSTIEHGFRRTDNVEGSTREDANFLAGPRPKDGRPRQVWLERRPTEEHVARAEAVLAWIRTSTESTDYAHNLRVACAQPVVMSKARGLLASAPNALDRYEGIQRERAQRAPNAGHFGAVGEKFDAKVTVGTAKYVEGYMGGTSQRMLNLTDDAGHVFKVFTAGAAGDLDDYSGEWFMRATVKKHVEDRAGAPVTLITRVQLSREPFPAAKARRPKKAARDARTPEHAA